MHNPCCTCAHGVINQFLAWGELRLGNKMKDMTIERWSLADNCMVHSFGCTGNVTSDPCEILILSVYSVCLFICISVDLFVRRF